MSKTTFFELDGKQFKVELVEAKKPFTNEQIDFLSDLAAFMSNTFLLNGCDFNTNLATYHMKDQWQNFLISEARKRGFISGCTIKPATDMDKMKSGRLQLIGLSKLATDGRKQIIIYDGGKWRAEAIPEVKKHFWTVQNNGYFVRYVKNGTWETGNLLTRDEMEQVKCEPEKYNKDELRQIIDDLTRQINCNKTYHAVTNNQAITIREILNDYLK